MINAISYGNTSAVNPSYTSASNAVGAENSIHSGGTPQATFLSYGKNNEAQVRDNVNNDYAQGVLTPKESLADKAMKFIGCKPDTQDMVFNPAKYKEITGEDITYDGIKARYGLEPGVLKEANNLRFRSGDMSKPGQGANIGVYTPAELGNDEVIIPGVYKHVGASA